MKRRTLPSSVTWTRFLSYGVMRAPTHLYKTAELVSNVHKNVLIKMHWWTVNQVCYFTLWREAGIELIGNLFILFAKYHMHKKQKTVLQLKNLTFWQGTVMNPIYVYIILAIKWCVNQILWLFLNDLLWLFCETKECVLIKRELYEWC